MRRFVVLHHRCPNDRPRPTHWDFLVEWDAVLRGWALPGPPESSLQCDAQPLADHRREYLDYEGPVSAGRGDVSQWDAGTCEVLVAEDGCLVLAVHGGKLDGRVEFERRSRAKSAGKDAAVWLFRYFAAGTSEG